MCPLPRNNVLFSPWYPSWPVSRSRVWFLERWMETSISSLEESRCSACIFFYFSSHIWFSPLVKLGSHRLICVQQNVGIDWYGNEYCTNAHPWKALETPKHAYTHTHTHTHKNKHSAQLCSGSLIAFCSILFVPFDTDFPSRQQKPTQPMKDLSHWFCTDAFSSSESICLSGASCSENHGIAQHRVRWVWG